MDVSPVLWVSFFVIAPTLLAIEIFVLPRRQPAAIAHRGDLVGRVPARGPFLRDGGGIGAWPPRRAARRVR